MDGQKVDLFLEIKKVALGPPKEVYYRNPDSSRTIKRKKDFSRYANVWGTM